MTNKSLKIAIASDHAGFMYKEKIKSYLISHGYDIADFGTDSDAPVDYPDKIRPAAVAVAEHSCNLGIVLGGSGNGEAIVANKVKGIRCAVCWNTKSARLAKEHNNANMISLGQRMMGSTTAIRIVNSWLNASFQGGRHQKRIDKIEIRGSGLK